MARTLTNIWEKCCSIFIYNTTISNENDREKARNQPPCLPFFFITDLTKSKQTIRKAKAAKPPTAMATVLCVLWLDPTPLKPNQCAIILITKKCIFYTCMNWKWPKYFYIESLFLSIFNKSKVGLEFFNFQSMISHRRIRKRKEDEKHPNFSLRFNMWKRNLNYWKWMNIRN